MTQRTADEVRAEIRSTAILEFCAKAGIGALQQVNGLPDDVRLFRLNSAVAHRRAELATIERNDNDRAG